MVILRGGILSENIVEVNYLLVLMLFCGCELSLLKYVYSFQLSAQGMVGPHPQPNFPTIVENSDIT